MSTIHSKVTKVGRLNIRYFTGGQGDPLIVIHGGAEGAISWFKDAVELSKNYNVYIPDLPGFGDSQSMSEDFYLPSFVSFVDDFSRSLGLKKFNLVGHSLGGRIALGYALKHPQKTKKLVLVSSIGLGKEITLWARLACWLFGHAGMGIIKAIKWLVKSLNINHGVTKISGFSISMGKSLMNFKGQTTVLLNQLSNLLVPTLLVWGAKDNVVPVAHCYAASKMIPDCQFQVFDDCGHSVYRQKTKEFCQVLSSFLS